MTKLNKNQIIMIINKLFPVESKGVFNKALLEYFFTDASMYKIENDADLPANALAPKARRVRQEITYIESLFK